MNKIHVDTFIEYFQHWDEQIPCVYCGDENIKLIENNMMTGRYQCTNCYKQWFYNNSRKVYEQNPC